jgi:hypothetical protein
MEYSFTGVRWLGSAGGDNVYIKRSLVVVDEGWAGADGSALSNVSG